MSNIADHILSLEEAVKVALHHCENGIYAPRERKLIERLKGGGRRNDGS